MKRIIISAALTLILAGNAYAISESDYKSLKKSSADLARADRKLTQVWKKIAGKMPGIPFKTLQNEQRDWIAEGRDEEAERYIGMGYSQAKAYALATDDRAEYLPERAREIMNMR
ncbi:MAG: DUF1311 domain-containing protein [Synergistaceae bacterium]|nr:DUF1311 domain-containing protein [Synergistaceae bacterium]